MAEPGNGNPRLPQHILDKITESLKRSPEKLVAVMLFFSLREVGETARYIQALTSVYDNDEAFRQFAERLAEDTIRLEKDEGYIRVMTDIWINYLHPNVKENAGNIYQFDYRMLLANRSLLHNAAYFNFIDTLSKLPSSSQNEVVQLITGLIEALPVVSSATSVTLRQSLKVGLISTRVLPGNLVGVTLAAVYLTREIYHNMTRWWNGEISGARCAKNVIDSFAGVAAGFGGGYLGATIGNFVAPGIGGAVGAVLGGVASASMATTLSDWINQKIFNLPRDEALENAYRFLELTCNASNDQINSSYRRLALEYHPDKGGSYEQWHKLQLSMGLVKISRGESNNLDTP